MTKVRMEENRLLKVWNTGDMEKEPCMDEDRESQPCKKLSHSIDEILKRPVCIRAERTVHRSWSVIKDTRTSTQLSSSGTFLNISI